MRMDMSELSGLRLLHRNGELHLGMDGALHFVGAGLVEGELLRLARLDRADIGGGRTLHHDGVRNGVVVVELHAVADLDGHGLGIEHLAGLADRDFRGGSRRDRRAQRDLGGQDDGCEFHDVIVLFWSYGRTGSVMGRSCPVSVCMKATRSLTSWSFSGIGFMSWSRLGRSMPPCT